jgi:transposase
MRMQDRVIKPKLGLLKLAQELGNVSQACKMFGYSRDSYYRFKDQYATGGDMALQDLNRRKPNVKNRVDPEIEERVVAMAIEDPAFGQQRVSNELRKQGIFISLRLGCVAYGSGMILRPSRSDSRLWRQR